MELTARFNGPPRLTGAALIIVCGYRGGSARADVRASQVPKINRLINALTLLRLRRFTAAMRDHFANPRDAAYQAALVEAVLERSRFSSCRIWIDERLALTDWAATLGERHDVRLRPVGPDALEGEAPFETAVLVYPDALGLTWGALERALMKRTGNVVVVNGRRRLFTLDRTVRRMLAWRRFLAGSRVVELVWGVTVVPVAAVLALWDRAHGRS